MPRLLMLERCAKIMCLCGAHYDGIILWKSLIFGDLVYCVMASLVQIYSLGCYKFVVKKLCNIECGGFTGVDCESAKNNMMDNEPNMN